LEEEPLELYSKQVEAGIFSTLPYDRLMIHYRKEKEYEKELGIIKKAIATFRNYYNEKQSDILKTKISPKIKALSKKISKSTGLLDKKGNVTYLPEPLPRWMKRQAVVEQKISKKK
jgi:hypothetical protein